MIWSILASFAAIGTGFMSTLCCVGPATLKVIGLAGFNIGPWFAENRPYNVTATILLLGAAYYMEYGRTQKDEGEAGAEEISLEPKTEKKNWAKIALWTAYGLIMFFKLTPEVITFVYNY